MKNEAFGGFLSFSGSGELLGEGKGFMMKKIKTAKGRFWEAQLRCVGVLLTVWFMASFGAGILFRDWLDANFPRVGSAPFGFWMAQQGAILVFVFLLVIYAFWMARIEGQFSDEEEGER